jgi:diguanylate cyclase (GGDEF)-like protein
MNRKRRLAALHREDPSVRRPEQNGIDGLSPTQETSSTSGWVVASVESMFQQLSTDPDGVRPSAVATPRTGKYDPLWQLSMSDPQTGLVNQLLLLDRLGQALSRRKRHGGHVIVVHIDLTNLGDIHSELGYTAGNEVISEMSRRLTSILRNDDTVGRVGASDLVAIMTISDENAVEMLAQRLKAALAGPVTVSGHGIRLHANLGVAVATDSETAEDVLARANRAA